MKIKQIKSFDCQTQVNEWIEKNNIDIEDLRALMNLLSSVGLIQYHNFEGVIKVSIKNIWDFENENN